MTEPWEMDWSGAVPAAKSAALEPWDMDWSKPPAPEKPVEGGFAASAKSMAGSAIKGAGQLAADVLPGVDQDNAVKRYGQGIIDRNPTAIQELSDISERPVTAVKEAAGNAAASVAGVVGTRIAGQAITAVAPLTGPAAPIVALVGQAVSWLGPAAIMALPSYGQIRDAQITKDPEAETAGRDKAVAALGATAVAVIETKFGPQGWALAALTKEGRTELAKKFAATSMPGAVAKGLAKGAAIEGTEELVQQPIQQLASYDDPLTGESLKETAFSGVMGAIGGGVLGGGAGAIARVTESPKQKAVEPPATILDAGSVDEAVAAFKFEVSGEKSDLTELRRTYKNLDDAGIAANQAELLKALELDPTFAKDEAGNPTAYGAPLKVVSPQELPEVSEDGALTRDSYEAIAAINVASGLKTVVYQDHDNLPDGLVKQPDVVFISNKTSIDPVVVAMHEAQHLAESDPAFATYRSIVDEELSENALVLARLRHGDLADAKLKGEIRADIAGDFWADPSTHGRVLDKMRLQLGDAAAEKQATSFLDSIKNLLVRIKETLLGTTFTSPDGKRLASQYVRSLERVHDALAAAIADRFVTEGYRPPGASTNSSQLILARALEQQTSRAAALEVPAFQRTSEQRIRAEAPSLVAPVGSSPELVSALAAAAKAPFDRTTEERINLEAIRIGVRMSPKQLWSMTDAQWAKHKKELPSNEDKGAAVRERAAQTERAVQKALDQEWVAMPALEKKLGIHPGRIAGALRELEKRGVVERKEVPGAMFNENRYRAVGGENSDIQRSLKSPERTRLAEIKASTPEFKRWFKDSKVVDRAGAPLVVYHGTGQDFDKPKDGVFWASDAATTAETFAEFSRGEPSIIPAHMTITNPLVVDADGLERNDIRFRGKVVDTDQLAAIAKAEGHDGVIVRNVFDSFDGEGGLATSYAVFNPTQVKSVFNQKPTDRAGLSRSPKSPEQLRVRELMEQARPLAQKGGLTRMEAEKFKALNREITSLRYGLEKPGKVEDVLPATERKSALSPEVNAAAHAALLKNKPIYMAVREAAHGISFNADTPVDDIVNGKNPDVTAKVLYETFAATREALRQEHGDVMTLFRATGAQKDKATTNWATTREFALQFGTNVVSRDIPVADIIAVHVTRNGKYHEVIVGKAGDIQRSPKSERAKIEAARSGVVVNIGLAVNDGSTVSESKARTALKLAGVKILSASIQKSDTEQTLVATLDRALTPAQANAVAVNLKQEAIAQTVSGKGELYGPGAANWRPFNPAFFLTPDGKRLSDAEPAPRKAPAAVDQRTGVALTKAMRSASLDEVLYGDRPPYTAGTQVELGELLQDLATTDHPARTDDTLENREFVARVIEHEARLALAQEGHAVGWYGKTTDAAIRIAALINPEIATDADARFAFTYALAVTSNGATIAENVRNAFVVYKSYSNAGRMPGIGFGVRANNMRIAFRIWNERVKKMGLPAFRDFMLSLHSVRDLKKINPFIAEMVDAQVYGGTVIGPKIGGAFLQNLNGNHDALAMDRWFMRTWGRITGDLVGMKRGEKVTKDTPANPSQRQYIRGTMAMALARLQKDHPALTMSDLQAVLWYPEKDLYAMHGVNDESGRPTDYEIEAAAYAKLKGVDSAEIEAARVPPSLSAGRGAAGEYREPGVGREAAFSPKTGDGRRAAGASEGARDARREPGRADQQGRTPEGWSRQVGPRTPAFRFHPRGPGKSPVAIVGIHYGGTPALAELDPNRFGTGTRAQERERISSFTPHLLRRVYFYAVKGGLPQGEGIVTGGHAYRLLATNLYDTYEDPDGIIALWVKEGRPNGMNGLEQGILASGYDGYLNRDHTPDGAFVIIGADKGVPVEYLGTRAEARGKLQFSPKSRATVVGDSTVIDLTRTERAYFGEVFTSEADRQELLSEVPSAKYDGERLTVATSDLGALTQYVDDTASLDEGTLPPSFTKATFPPRGPQLSPKQDGKRYIIWDTQKQQQVGESYGHRGRARTRADKLDLEYGAVRYQVRPAPTALDTDMRDQAAWLAQKARDEGYATLDALSPARFAELAAEWRAAHPRDGEVKFSSKLKVAFRTESGVVLPARNGEVMHGQLYGTILSRPAFQDVGELTPGFVDESGQFYDRVEALKKFDIAESSELNFSPKTPEFKKWFAGSKVVDEKGEPLAVYHGTAGQFDAFDAERLGQHYDNPVSRAGFFFVEEEYKAEEWAQLASEEIHRKPRVIAAYLSLQNPAEIDGSVYGPSAVDTQALADDLTRVKARGFDGAIIRGWVDGSNVDTQYVAFEPNQIKAVDNARPTDDPRIQFSPKTIAESSLPMDMKVLLQDVWEIARKGKGAIPKNLPLVSIPIEQFPVVRLPGPMSGDDRGRRHAKGMVATPVGDIPPVVVIGDDWIDGRHRLAAARIRGDRFVRAIDLGPLGATWPDSTSPFLGKLKRSPQFSPKIVGDSKRPYDAAQRRMFQNVGRSVEVPTLRTRIAEMRKDLGKKMAQGLVDQFAPLKELSPMAYMLARLSKGSAGALEALLRHGKLRLNAGAFDADRSGGFIERVGIPLHGELEDFLWWVAANRAERLTAQDRERLFSRSDIAAGKSLANGNLGFDYTLAGGQTTRVRAQAYADSLKKFDAFNKNALDMAEQSGLIDSTTRPIWEQEFYVPFYRVSEEDGSFIGGNIGNALVRQRAFKRLKGGEQKLNSDLLANTIANWAHLIDASAKNRAAKASLEAATQMGVAVEADAATIKSMGKSIGKNGVWFMDGGVQRHFLVDDPFVLTAITSLDYSGMKGPVMDAMSSFKHILTVGVTASPFFKIKNLIRDSLQAIAVAPIGANPLANIREGFAASEHSTQTYVSALASGGLIRFGTMLEGRMSDRVRQLVKAGVKDTTILNSDSKLQALYDRLIDPAVAAYNELGNRSEEITRAALYTQLTAKGMDHATASLMARDLMDFSLQGSWTGVRFLTQVVPFMNARMQGLYKLGRGAVDDPKRFAAVLGATAMFSIALLAAYSDDDDWKKREDWDRDNFWWLKIGGTAFRIPKPFEIGAIATLAERGLEYFLSPEMTGERFRKTTLDLVANNLSMNPVPQLFKPIVDMYANKDSFSGRPIETMGMERLEPDYRFNSRTSLLARAAGTAGQSVTSLVGADFVSPVKIDHALRGYFGWLGTFVVGAADMIARPLTNEAERPAGDLWKLASGNMISEVPTDSSRYVSHMYEQARVIEQAYGTYRALLKQGKGAEAKEYLEDNRDKIAKYRAVQQVKRAETALNERTRIIERSALDPEAKRVAIAAIALQKDRIARLVN